MARIRTIKPEFFNSFDVASVTPLARLFYAYLWTESDREGLLEWKPKNFKMRFFPLDDCDIEALGQELIDQGMIIIHGGEICQIPSFTKHQVINNRESESVLLERVKDACTRVKAEGRKEGKGKEHASRDGEIDFDQFWERYPRKEDKKKSKIAWERLSVKNQQLAYEDCATRFQETERQFIPIPTTYIHGERWNDQRKESQADRFAGFR